MSSQLSGRVFGRGDSNPRSSLSKVAVIGGGWDSNPEGFVLGVVEVGVRSLSLSASCCEAGVSVSCGLLDKRSLSVDGPK